MRKNPGTNKQGRNDPCPCGSGKKYKQCCLLKQAPAVGDFSWRKMRETEGELIHSLLKHSVKYYGQEAFAEAWNEFSLWTEAPMDADTQQELDTIFLPWFVFNWVPDNTQAAAADYFPELPIAMHYLQQRGSRVDAYQQRFIREACARAYSFFVVTDLKSGQFLSLRDLFVGREVAVRERQASTTLSKGSIVYTRIMTLDDTSIMLGCAPIAIPPEWLNEFIDFREEMQAKTPMRGEEFLFQHDIELRTLYYDIREALFNPVLPEIQNTDGEALQLTALHYTLTCTPSQALDALATLSLGGIDQSVSEQGEFDAQGNLVSIEFPWMKKGNRKHASWNNTILGHIIIDGDRLTINVNSQERADAIKRRITRRLGKLARFRTAVIQSPEKAMQELKSQPSRGGQNSSTQQHEALQALPEVQEKLREMAAQHWAEWLDTALPALKGETPRAAVKTPIGRERVEALLMQFSRTGQSPQPFDPDIDALREALGLND